MKRLLALLLLFAAVSARSSYIMWVGMDENATISDGVSTVNFLVYLSAKADAVNMGGRIRIGDEALPAGYEDPPDQNPPAVSFDDEIVDFGLVVVDGDDQPTGAYGDWQPIKIPDDVSPYSHVKVYYDIGYWDEADDWNFVKVATAEEWLDVLYNEGHIYEAGTLAPPIETPWRPLEYSTVVPEPSTGALFLLGTFLLFRKNRAAPSDHTN